MAKATVSKKPASPAKPTAKKAAAVDEMDEDELSALLDGASEVDPEAVEPLELDDEEVITTPPPSKKKGAAAVPALKATVTKTAKPASDKMKGLTAAIKESGVIGFSDGSGSQGILLLITKYGHDREKVLKAASASEKFKAKYFSKSDPVKKYGKISGIIQNLQKLGYKLPKLGQ